MKKILIVAFLITTCFLTIKAQQVSKLPKDPIIILGFDDAEESAISVVAPLLKKYHFDATFFVCEFPRKTPADSAFYMSWPQILKLHKMGFEIGNHTGHHKDMTKLTVEEMKAEVSFIEDKCKAFGIPRPISFAYPGNRVDSAAQAVLKQMGYQFARAGGSRYFDPAKDPLLAIPSFTMGSNEELGPRTMKALENVKPGQILAFTIHGVPDIAHPKFSTSAEAFEMYLKYMYDHHFKVIAMRDLPKYLNQ